MARPAISMGCLNCLLYSSYAQSEYFKIYQNIFKLPEYIRIFQNILEYFKMYQNIFKLPEYIRIFKNISDTSEYIS